jgi:TRAP transporter TAXI family solute receptor
MQFNHGRIAFTLALTALAAPAFAQSNTQTSEIKLPDQLAWTAYDTGSAGYNQAVAIGSALKNELGTDLRVLPGKNDVSRTEPLRQGRVQFSATGIGGSYMAQEGAFEFGDPRWGPQPIRVLLANAGGDINLAVGVAGDLGVDSYDDLKGKRVAYVQGAPALNVNTEAYLACGGLTWDDVERVDFGGFGDAWTGLINGQVDTAFASTNSGNAYEAASGPRGLVWPTISPDDTECIERMQAIAPFFTPNTATVGATIDGAEPHQGMGYAYPVLIAMEDQDPDLVYNMTKAMVELFDKYDGAAPGIGGWALKNQDFTWVAPYHEGAIRYFKEIGAWSDEAQAHNDQLVARQEALQKAWEELKAQNVPEGEWEQRWTEARRAALQEGGFQVVF